MTRRDEPQSLSRSGGRLQAIPDRAQDGTAVILPGMRILHSSPSRQAHCEPSFGIVEQALERGHECRHVRRPRRSHRGRR
jgi:hypothetical protein